MQSQLIIWKLAGPVAHTHPGAMPRKGPPAPKPPDRDDRLAAALRENLKRRKAQSRARDAAAEQPPAPAKVADEKPMG